MKKAIYLFVSILLLMLVSLVVYCNLPIEITHKSDITYGNSLIENINSYKAENKKLPENEDWETLEKLGFRFENLGANPYYETDGHQFELVFIEGFDGPYLMWDSEEKEWRFDFPINYSIPKEENLELNQ